VLVVDSPSCLPPPPSIHLPTFYNLDSSPSPLKLALHRFLASLDPHPALNRLNLSLIFSGVSLSLANGRPRIPLVQSFYITF
jgi:hypothetical protein